MSPGPSSPSLAVNIAFSSVYSPVSSCGEDKEGEEGLVDEEEKEMGGVKIVEDTEGGGDYTTARELFIRNREKRDMKASLTL